MSFLDLRSFTGLTVSNAEVGLLRWSDILKLLDIMSEREEAQLTFLIEMRVHDGFSTLSPGFSVACQ